MAVREGKERHSHKKLAPGKVRCLTPHSATTERLWDDIINFFLSFLWRGNCIYELDCSITHMKCMQQLFYEILSEKREDKVVLQINPGLLFLIIFSQQRNKC